MKSHVVMVKSAVAPGGSVRLVKVLLRRREGRGRDEIRRASVLVFVSSARHPVEQLPRNDVEKGGSYDAKAKREVDDSTVEHPDYLARRGGGP